MENSVQSVGCSATTAGSVQLSDGIFESLPASDTDSANNTSLELAASEVSLAVKDNSSLKLTDEASLENALKNSVDEVTISEQEKTFVDPCTLDIDRNCDHSVVSLSTGLPSVNELYSRTDDELPPSQTETAVPSSCLLVDDEKSDNSAILREILESDALVEKNPSKTYLPVKEVPTSIKTVQNHTELAVINAEQVSNSVPSNCDINTVATSSNLQVNSSDSNSLNISKCEGVTDRSFCAKTCSAGREMYRAEDSCEVLAATCSDVVFEHCADNIQNQSNDVNILIKTSNEVEPCRCEPMSGTSIKNVSSANDMEILNAVTRSSGTEDFGNSKSLNENIEHKPDDAVCQLDSTASQSADSSELQPSEHGTIPNEIDTSTSAVIDNPTPCNDSRFIQIESVSTDTNSVSTVLAESEIMECETAVEIIGQRAIDGITFDAKSNPESESSSCADSGLASITDSGGSSTADIASNVMDCDEAEPVLTSHIDGGVKEFLANVKGSNVPVDIRDFHDTAKEPNFDIEVKDANVDTKEKEANNDNEWKETSVNIDKQGYFDLGRKDKLIDTDLDLDSRDAVQVSDAPASPRTSGALPVAETVDVPSNVETFDVPSSAEAADIPASIETVGELSTPDQISRERTELESTVNELDVVHEGIQLNDMAEHVAADDELNETKHTVEQEHLELHKALLHVEGPKANIAMHVLESGDEVDGIGGLVINSVVGAVEDVDEPLDDSNKQLADLSSTITFQNVATVDEVDLHTTGPRGGLPRAKRPRLDESEAHLPRPVVLKVRPTKSARCFSWDLEKLRSIITEKGSVLLQLVAVQPAQEDDDDAGADLKGVLLSNTEESVYVSYNHADNNGIDYYGGMPPYCEAYPCNYSRASDGTEDDFVETEEVEELGEYEGRAQSPEWQGKSPNSGSHRKVPLHYYSSPMSPPLLRTKRKLGMRGRPPLHRRDPYSVHHQPHNAYTSHFYVPSPGAVHYQRYQQAPHVLTLPSPAALPSVYTNHTGHKVRHHHKTSTKSIVFRPPTPPPRLTDDARCLAQSTPTSSVLSSAYRRCSSLLSIRRPAPGSILSQQIKQQSMEESSSVDRGNGAGIDADGEELGKNERVTCDYCPAKFCKRSSLITHVKHKHSLMKKCPICHEGVRVKGKYNMKFHMLKKHKDINTFACGDCGAVFRLQHHLKNHLRLGCAQNDEDISAQSAEQSRDANNHVASGDGELELSCETPDDKNVSSGEIVPSSKPDISEYDDRPGPNKKRKRKLSVDETTDAKLKASSKPRNRGVKGPSVSVLKKRVSTESIGPGVEGNAKNSVNKLSTDEPHSNKEETQPELNKDSFVSSNSRDALDSNKCSESVTKSCKKTNTSERSNKQGKSRSRICIQSDSDEEDNDLKPPAKKKKWMGRPSNSSKVSSPKPRRGRPPGLKNMLKPSAGSHLDKIAKKRVTLDEDDSLSRLPALSAVDDSNDIDVSKVSLESLSGSDDEASSEKVHSSQSMQKEDKALEKPSTDKDVKSLERASSGTEVKTLVKTSSKKHEKTIDNVSVKKVDKTVDKVPSDKDGKITEKQSPEKEEKSSSKTNQNVVRRGRKLADIDDSDDSDVQAKISRVSCSPRKKTSRVIESESSGSDSDDESSSESEVEEKKHFFCNECDAGFSHAFKLKHHKREIHSNNNQRVLTKKEELSPKLLVCNVCNKQCRNSALLRLHLLSHKLSERKTHRQPRKRLLSDVSAEGDKSEDKAEENDKRELHEDEDVDGNEKEKEQIEEGEEEEDEDEDDEEEQKLKKSVTKRIPKGSFEKLPSYIVRRTRLFICTKCNLSFKREKSVIYHMKKIHETLYPFRACSDCGKIFRSCGPYLRHIKMHQVRLCPVPGCKARYRAIRKMKQHQKQHEDYPHRCTCCEALFKHAKELDEHFKVTHSKRRSVKQDEEEEEEDEDDASEGEQDVSEQTEETKKDKASNNSFVDGLDIENLPDKRRTRTELNYREEDDDEPLIRARPMPMLDKSPARRKHSSVKLANKSYSPKKGFNTSPKKAVRKLSEVEKLKKTDFDIFKGEADGVDRNTKRKAADVFSRVPSNPIKKPLKKKVDMSWTAALKAKIRAEARAVARMSSPPPQIKTPKAAKPKVPKSAAVKSPPLFMDHPKSPSEMMASDNLAALVVRRVAQNLASKEVADLKPPESVKSTSSTPPSPAPPHPTALYHSHHHPYYPSSPHHLSPYHHPHAASYYTPYPSLRHVYPPYHHHPSSYHHPGGLYTGSEDSCSSVDTAQDGLDRSGSPNRIVRFDNF